MTDNKFKSKQELDEYIKNNSTSFEEFEKRLDYSLFEKRSKKNKKHKGFSLKKLGYAIVSFVMVICVTIVGYFIHSHFKINKCPYELGTYTFYSQEGNIEGLDFSEKSYIVLTDQELSGPGTFIIKNKEWTINFSFHNCFLENREIMENTKNDPSFKIDEFVVEIENGEIKKNKAVFLKVGNDDNKILVYFVLDN